MKLYDNNVKWLVRLAFFIDLPISTAYITPFFLKSGLSQAEVFLLQSIFSVAFLLWNIPSGYLADRFGKATSIKVGAVIATIAMTSYGFGSHFWEFALCEVGLALGEGLINGADRALLIDTLAHAKKSNEFVKLTQRMSALQFAGTALAVPVAILLVAKVGLGATLVADGILFGVGALIATRLREVPKQGASLEDKNLTVWSALKGFIAKPEVRYLLVLTSALGAAPYLAFWLTAPYYNHLGVPVLAFSLLLALRSLWKAWLSHRFQEIKNMKRVMSAYAATSGIVYLGMATGQIWLIWVVLGHDVVESLQGAPLTKKINEFVQQKYRATINSVVGLSQRLVYMVAGPLVGLVVDKHGLSKGFIAAGVMCSLVGFVAVQRLSSKGVL